jgi:hypothetical protein
MSQFLDREAAVDLSEYSSGCLASDTEESDGGNVSEEIPLPRSTPKGSGQYAHTRTQPTPKGQSATTQPRHIIESGSDGEDILPRLKRRKFRKTKASCGHNSQQTCDSEVLKEIQKSNKLLATLVKRVGNNEKRLEIFCGRKGHECKQWNRFNTFQKKDVPAEVRVSVVILYCTLFTGIQIDQNLHPLK